MRKQNSGRRILGRAPGYGLVMGIKITDTEARTGRRGRTQSGDEPASAGTGGSGGSSSSEGGRGNSVGSPG